MSTLRLLFLPKPTKKAVWPKALPFTASTGAATNTTRWSGHKHHPADGYDGPQGGGYPAPTGARDEYSYSVSGIARSIKFNPTDTRNISQRFRDNYANLGSNFSDRANEANKKMFDHNPNLDRWGNTMEFINGVAAGAVNPFLSAGEAVGLGDEKIRRFYKNSNGFPVCKI